MKKLAIVLILSCLLGGCGKRVSQWQLRVAENVCKDRGGIDYIFSDSLITHPSVRCINGEHIVIKSGY